MPIKLNKLNTVSKTLSLGVSSVMMLSVVLFSGCSEGSEGSETEFYQEDVVQQTTDTTDIEPDSEDNPDSPDKVAYNFGVDDNYQNKQYLFQKESSPEMSDREILNSHLNYCAQQKQVALEATQYKLAGVNRETTLLSIEGNVEKYTPLWDDVTRVIMFAYSAPNTVDKELRGKIGNPSSVHQSLHPDDVANKVFIMCMQNYGHFTDYKIQ